MKHFFLLMVITEMLKCTCIPSFTPKCCIVCKLQKGTSNYEKLPEAIFDGCHGNNEIHMSKNIHSHVQYSLQLLRSEK